VKHVLPWLAWWVALFWLWLLLVGQWNREQVVAAAIAATIAASVAELARTRTGLSAPLPLRLLADVPPALGMVVVDFGILSWALLAGSARRRIVRGELVSRERPPGSWVTQGAGPRAWTVLVAASRWRPIDGLVALETAGAVATLALLCLSVGLGESIFFTVALIAVVASWIGGFVFVRFLGRWT